jgi:hypothetical protein
MPQPMDDDRERSQFAELEAISRDHTRHRASKGWINEAFGLCLGAFAWNTFSVVSGFARTGRPGPPGLLGALLFGLAIAAVPVALGSLGRNSTLPPNRRRGYRLRLYAVAVLACVPVVVGTVGRIVYVVLSMEPPAVTLESAAQRLARIAGGPVREYSTYDFGRARDPDARSVIVADERSLDILSEIRGQIEGDLVAFIGTTSWLGDEPHQGVEIVVAKGGSQFDILRVARSDAINYGMETEALIEKLTEYDRQYGIDILHAETNTIEFALSRLPHDLTAFCQDLYEFCPDIVDQGTGTVEDLEAEIRDNEVVYLWWD